jgi:hypothetical protein
MKLIRPISEEKRQQLRQVLAREKIRLDRAATQAAQVIHRNASVTQWIRNYPLESALLVVASGIVLAKTLQGEGRLPDRDFRAIYD